MGDVIPNWILLRVLHLPVAQHISFCPTWHGYSCKAPLLPHHTHPNFSTSPLLDFCYQPRLCISPPLCSPASPGSSLLHLVVWPHTTAARSKETVLRGTQAFLPMLFEWSLYLHDKQSWTNMGFFRKNQCIGLNPAPNLCGRNQALAPDSNLVEQFLFSRTWVLKNSDSPSCTETQMIILS